MSVMGINRWREERIKEARIFSKTFTSSNGTLEYSDVGSGYPVLFLHGSTGGCDSGPMLFDRVIKQGFRFICPSRPGFLLTELGNALDSDKQADLYKELLDHLNVKKVAVIGHSGGGPSAVAFVSKYPQMTDSLILYAAVSHRLNRKLKFREKLLTNETTLWFVYILASIFPRSVHKSLAKILYIPHYKYIKDDDTDVFLMWFLNSLMPIKGRVVGLKNDLLQFAKLNRPDYSKIKCPVYVFHGTHDHELPLTFSKYVARKLSGERVLFSDGGHEPTLFIKGDKVLKEMVNFIKENAHEK